jgi:hypothetical protein
VAPASDCHSQEKECDEKTLSNPFHHHQ